MRTLITICLLLCLSLPAAANLRVAHNADIRDVVHVEDELWIATGNGIFVYDLLSNSFSDHLVIGQLPDNSIRTIVARNDRIYVGTDNGLAVFAGGDITHYTPDQPGDLVDLPLAAIRSIDFGARGNLILGTFGNGVGFSGRNARTVTRADSLLDDKVYRVVQPRVGQTYFATSMGLCAFTDSLWVNYQSGAGIPRAEVRDMVVHRGVGYYLLLRGRGVYRFDGSRALRITPRNLFATGDISDIALDANGKLWACGAGGGIAFQRNGKWTRYTSEDPALAQQRWRCVSTDDEGNVFVGSAQGVLLRIDEDLRGRAVRLPAGLPSPRVDRVIASADQTLLINGGRLLRYDDRRRAFLETPFDDIVDVVRDGEGNLLCLRRWGLATFPDDRPIPIDIAQRQPVFTRSASAADGSIWLGTQNGDAYRWDGEIWLHHRRSSIGGGRIVDIVPATGGTVWMLRENGLSGYSGAKWTVFNRDDFGGQDPRAVAVAPSGAVVVATADSLWSGESTGWNPVRLPNVRHNAFVGSGLQSIVFGPGGRLAVAGTRGVGLIAPDRVRWLGPGELQGRDPLTLTLDEDGGLWVGFSRDGVKKIAAAELWTAP